MTATTDVTRQGGTPRPRMVGVDRALAVATAVDTTRRLGLLDPDDAVVLGAELELAVLAVLERGDRLAALLLERAAVQARADRHVAAMHALGQGVCLPCRKRLPCATLDEIRARGRLLTKALGVERKRLAVIAARVAPHDDSVGGA